MDHDFAVLVTAVDKDDATEKAIEHLFAMLQGKIEYKFTPATVRELEPGEAPMLGSVDYDFRDIKTPFTRQNREAEKLANMPPPPGLEYLAGAGPDKLIEELKKSSAGEKRDDRTRYLRRRH
jgi:hypothetical protein